MLIMSEYLLYKCKKCGWEIAAPSDGSDMVMESIVAYFVCHDCKSVFSRYYELGTIVEGPVSCPNCKSFHTANWKPADKCPECGSVLENQGFYCLED